MATVMVVDDSKTVRGYHRAILEEAGIDVVEAENGMEALERSLECDVGLYFVDVNMPVMDGYTFVRELRRRPEGRLTPVVMITTQHEENDRTDAFRVGATLFETKPVGAERLKAYARLFLDA